MQIGVPVCDIKITPFYLIPMYVYTVPKGVFLIFVCLFGVISGTAKLISTGRSLAVFFILINISLDYGGLTVHCTIWFN